LIGHGIAINMGQIVNALMGIFCQFCCRNRYQVRSPCLPLQFVALFSAETRSNIKMNERPKFGGGEGVENFNNMVIMPKNLTKSK
jgi:hypothetical protein